MAEKEYTRIKEIKESNGNYKIKVRVSRIWEAIDYTTNTVKSLDTLLLDEHETHFTCKASITKVLHDNGWYYKACPHCAKKITTNAEGYECTKHGNVEPIPKYILKMEIEDNTATTMATLFEQEASSLLQKSAKELLTMEENGTEIAEKEFGRLIGHTTIFQIRVTRFNKEQNNNSLTISKIFPVNKIDNTEQNQKDNYDATPSDNASRNTKITHQITHHSKAHLDGTVATIIEDSNNTNDGEDEQPPTKRICRTNEDNQE
ncbi:hypothetical protein IFM89_031096 [Coptis chinensis]|uniref:Replication factor A C-terminal domain-containing protein n=1 Tax=Coptis chinensis TaxID=261450 RepID=A0A835ISL9_9MAGN|nr:hypothetical protein IFM89_031096 [Coptis chinensis]